MRKNPIKSNKQVKTKIELKIKSKNMTNNFILTPRTDSPREHRELVHNPDRCIEEYKTDRPQYNEITPQKVGKNSKATEYRRVSTDNTKLNLKKRFEEDETGTHTPLVKRVSITH